MNREWNLVREFQSRFGHPVSDYPQEMSHGRAIKRYDWMLEELNEFIAADEIVEQADAMIDLIYFALGTLVEMGIKPDNLFDIVQEANMAKLWPDGTPHYNSEGKTAKPDGWEDPHAKLEREIMRQYAEARGESTRDREESTGRKSGPPQ
ncbi:MAG: HAD family hydrolase [Deltaproteobacteria bacterium]|nr:HAD family hydrolase [Deltaproteobacteria bacterium]